MNSRRRAFIRKVTSQSETELTDNTFFKLFKEYNDDMNALQSSVNEMKKHWSSKLKEKLDKAFCKKQSGGDGGSNGDSDNECEVAGVEIDDGEALFQARIKTNSAYLLII